MKTFFVLPLLIIAALCNINPFYSKPSVMFITQNETRANQHLLNGGQGDWVEINFDQDVAYYQKVEIMISILEAESLAAKLLNYLQVNQEAGSVFYHQFLYGPTDPALFQATIKNLTNYLNNMQSINPIWKINDPGCVANAKAYALKLHTGDIALCPKLWDSYPIKSAFYGMISIANSVLHETLHLAGNIHLPPNRGSPWANYQECYDVNCCMNQYMQPDVTFGSPFCYIRMVLSLPTTLQITSADNKGCYLDSTNFLKCDGSQAADTLLCTNPPNCDFEIRGQYLTQDTLSQRLTISQTSSNFNLLKIDGFGYSKIQLNSNDLYVDYNDNNYLKVKAGPILQFHADYLGVIIEGSTPMPRVFTDMSTSTCHYSLLNNIPICNDNNDKPEFWGSSSAAIMKSNSGTYYDPNTNRYETNLPLYPLNLTNTNTISGVPWKSLNISWIDGNSVKKFLCTTAITPFYNKIGGVVNGKASDCEWQDI